MAQANELLRAHGIDPTGEGLEGSEEPADPSTEGPEAAPIPPAPVESVTLTSAKSPTHAPLDLDAIRADPDVWPAKVVMLETVDFQSGLRLTPGNQVDFSGWQDAENIYLDYGEYNLTLPVGFTDLEERANEVARGQAKADGFRGRLLEQLDGRIVVPEGEGMIRTGAEALGGADLYLLYMSSEACGWCRLFTPKLVKAVAQIEREFPGRLRVLHASVDRNMPEFVQQYRKIGAAAAIPPGDRWYINAYTVLHPGVSQIAQPSLMLLNVNGRLIDSSARQGSDTSGVEAALDRLPGHLARVDELRPAWVALEAPIPLGSSPSDLPPADLPPIVPNTDPTIAGPLPYPAEMSDGRAVPGLVLHDTKVTDGRVPALTLQAFPAEDGNGVYYHLAFRQVLGKTYSSSRPLLSIFMESKTRSGASAQADLEERVAAFKDLHARYERWKATAIANRVTEFQKPIVTMAHSSYDHPYARSALTRRKDILEDELEVLFMVQNDPQFPLMKTGNVTWMRDTMDAFTRLIPQLDSLVSQLPHEAVRLAGSRQEKVEELQNVDALFQ